MSCPAEGLFMWDDHCYPSLCSLDTTLGWLVGPLAEQCRKLSRTLSELSLWQYACQIYEKSIPLCCQQWQMTSILPRALRFSFWLVYAFTSKQNIGRFSSADPIRWTQFSDWPSKSNGNLPVNVLYNYSNFSLLGLVLSVWPVVTGYFPRLLSVERVC